MNNLALKETLKLVQLGLTKQEASIYLILWEKGPMTAEQIAKHIKSLPQAASRSAKKLEFIHLVNSANTYPQTYRAIPPSVSLPSLIETKTSQLQATAEQVTNRLSKTIPKLDTTMNLIMGKEESYMYGAKLLNQTKKEMLVISVGEAIPEELLLSVLKARNRGVKIRMIIQKYDDQNKEIVKNFKKNGYEIRFAPSKGFSLAVYDGKQSLLIINNTETTKEHAAVHIMSNGLSESLMDYFYKIWETAILV
jgi:sugar-specific transcriptional regulator TrmB